MRAALLLIVLVASSFPVVAQAQDEPAADVAQSPELRSDGPRLRYGISLGVFGGGGQSEDIPDVLGLRQAVAPGFGAELQGRIGIQVADRFALLYQASLAGGPEVRVCLRWGSCDASDNFIVLHASSLVAEFTTARGFQLGVGGTAVIAHYGVDRPSTDIRFGFLGRLGYAFGGTGPGERRGFSIALQGGMAFAPSGPLLPLVDVALSLGWESF